ncbi:MAG: TrkH family potassium uptake protein [Planctomycetia bacterium]|nr:TrkH family potassium uptake protein [Planctomycetia bacterium]
MNYRVILGFLGLTSALVGAAMLLSTPWSWRVCSVDPNEARGVRALLITGFGSILLGGALALCGRGANVERFYRRDAIASVTLCWILAILLGAIPFLLAEVQRAPATPMSLVDALFESTSGITTTGATVISDLENRDAIPRVIVFWRGMTHFLGGLGVVCLYVAFLGHGVGGKAAMQVENSGALDQSFTTMRSYAFSMCALYAALTALCIIALSFCGASLFDSFIHSFSVTSLGGFSNYNSSVGHFMHDPRVNYVAVEYVLAFFMALASMNHALLWTLVLGKPSKLWHDTETRWFLSLLLVATIALTTAGMLKGDFNVQFKTKPHPLEVTDLSTLSPELTASHEDVTLPPRYRASDAFRCSLFHVLSLWTGAGIATTTYENWNSAAIILLVALMFCGGCTGSPSGGVKVFRVILVLKSLSQGLRRYFRPNVVRAMRLDNQIVPPDRVLAALGYIVTLAFFVLVTAILVNFIEPDTIWDARGVSSMEKLIDLTSGSLAMHANVGLGLGALGSCGNYGQLTVVTKLIFSWAMLLGRLEIWAVLALLTPDFWRRS